MFLSEEPLLCVASPALPCDRSTLPSYFFPFPAPRSRETIGVISSAELSAALCPACDCEPASWGMPVSVKDGDREERSAAPGPGGEEEKWTLCFREVLGGGGLELEGADLGSEVCTEPSGTVDAIVSGRVGVKGVKGD